MNHACWKCYAPLNTAGICTKCGEPNASHPAGPQHYPTPDILKEIFGRPGAPDPKPAPVPQPKKEKEKA